MIQASWQAPERFAEIYDAYFVEIHKYVERRLGRDIADDLAAETFVAAFRQHQRYDRARGDARAWLYGIATNLVRRHRRREVAAYKALARPARRRALRSMRTGWTPESLRWGYGHSSSRHSHG